MAFEIDDFLLFDTAEDTPDLVGVSGNTEFDDDNPEFKYPDKYIIARIVEVQPEQEVPIDG